MLSIAVGFLIGGAETTRKPVEPASAGGKTYPNLYVADQHHAKNCVPAGL